MIRLNLKAQQTLCLGVLVGLSFVLSYPVSASKQAYVKPEELKALPEWCSHTPSPVIRGYTGIPPASARARAELQRMKDSGCARALHHYCWGLVRSNRANFDRDSRSRDINLRTALSDVDYVAKNSAPTCSLFPQIHLRSGEWHLRLGDTTAALVRFQKAIAVDPSLQQAYSGLSRVYQLLDRPDEAIATLEDGIKANPKSKLLKKRLDSLRAELASTEASKTPK